MLMFFPLIAAALYSVSVILVKEYSSFGKMSGVGALILNNAIMCAVFAPALFLGGNVNLHKLWEPVLIGVFWGLANIATFICAQKGEVSLMTPIMGVKVLIVFVFAHFLIGAVLTTPMYIAGFACCFAVFLMGFDKSSLKSKKFAITLFLALAACTSYAMADVLIQTFSSDFSPWHMLAISSVSVLVSSFPFLHKFAAEVRNADKKSLSLCALAALIMAVESLFIFYAIREGVGAALCNILYNMRGVISVVLVFILGKKLKGVAELNTTMATKRLVGSIIIIAAVAFAVFTK